MSQMKKTLNTLPADRDIRVAGRFKLTKKIGSGAFGDIYVGTLLYTIMIDSFFVSGGFNVFKVGSS